MSQVDGSPITVATRDKMVAVCQGNPGALTVLVQLAVVPSLIDHLHEHGPRGTDLWALYKGECGKDIVLLFEVLSARASEFPM